MDAVGPASGFEYVNDLFRKVVPQREDLGTYFSIQPLGEHHLLEAKLTLESKLIFFGAVDAGSDLYIATLSLTRRANSKTSSPDPDKETSVSYKFNSLGLQEIIDTMHSLLYLPTGTDLYRIFELQTRSEQRKPSHAAEDIEQQLTSRGRRIHSLFDERDAAAKARQAIIYNKTAEYRPQGYLG
jgi:hypothetical protein